MNDAILSQVTGLPQQNLARRLLERRIITQETLERAAHEARQSGESLADALARANPTIRQVVYNELAGIHGVPYVDLRNYNYDPTVLSLLDERTARELNVVPLFSIDETATVAMADPGDIAVLDRVASVMRRTVETCFAPRADIRDTINRLYGGHSQVKAFLDRMDGSSVPVKADGIQEMLRSGESPISQLVDLILAQAVRDRASDIHFSPEENGLRIRFRIDGVLHDIPPPPKYLHPFVVSRIKIIGNMDIAENRIPQDGQFQATVDGRLVDARVSVLPTVHGEDLSIRMFDAQAVLTDLSSLGFSPSGLAKVEEMVASPSGLVVVSGPTGSGKSTTLYSMLERSRAPDRNIITIEDPVERRLKQVAQVQTNEKAGLTFASALRSILRHDPDIIMVGEIRDVETAQLAVRAALTGHLVFSTIHTNNAPSTVMRLVNMGIENLLVAASLSGVVAQRLARRVCDQCAEKTTVSDAARRRIKTASSVVPTAVSHGRGCPHCRNTGYRGRIGLFEIMPVTPALNERIVAGAPVADLRKQALDDGMVSLLDDGMEKAKQGLTTVEEVLRIAELESGATIDMPTHVTAQPPVSEEPAPADVSINLESYRSKIANWLSESSG